jgi:hypothetical protein
MTGEVCYGKSGPLLREEHESKIPGDNNNNWNDALL